MRSKSSNEVIIVNFDKDSKDYIYKGSFEDVLKKLDVIKLTALDHLIKEETKIKDI